MDCYVVNIFAVFMGVIGAVIGLSVAAIFVRVAMSYWLGCPI